MALKYNGRAVHLMPGVLIGANTNLPGNFIKGGLLNRYLGAFDSKFGGYINGTLASKSFILPLDPGSLASETDSSGSISGSATLTPARPMEASGTLTITVTNAQLDQIVSLVASGSLTMAKLDAILAGAANAQATGTLTLTVTNALCGAIFSVTATTSGSMSGVGSTLTALGFMEAEAGGATPLSPEGLSTELLDNQDIETGLSLRESVRIVLSALAGKVSGAGTATITFRNTSDTKDRIIATVDENGNRSVVTLDSTEG